MARRLSFSELSGEYGICKFESLAKIPEWAANAPFFSVTRTAEELSVVCPVEMIPKESQCETGWMLLKLLGPFAFTEVGVLAAFLKPLAATKISIVSISTFDTDYVLIKTAALDRAVAALLDAGHSILRESIQIREEQPDDVDAIHALNEAAFAGPLEANLVDDLRRQAAIFVSLVAELEGQIVGHILFSPVRIAGLGRETQALGLAPMAVLPDRQRQGIGSLLAREGLRYCRARGEGVVVVLGHPEYYPRFGFQPASRYRLRCEFPAPDEAFLVAELIPGALQGIEGIVRYHSAFHMKDSS